MSVYKHDKNTGIMLACVPNETKDIWLARRIQKFLRCRPHEYFDTMDLLSELDLLQEQRSVVTAALVILVKAKAVHLSKDRLHVCYKEGAFV